MVGDRPLVQVKPRAPKASAQAAAAEPGQQGAAKQGAKGKPQQSTAVRLQACLELEDGTKERLNCFDAVIAPQPKPKAAAAKGVADCRYMKEEDERLACFNGFAESIPKLPKS